MIVLIIFVPILIISILLLGYDYIKYYKNPKEEAKKNDGFGRYNNYFDYLISTCSSLRSVMSLIGIIISVFVLCITISVIAIERSDNRIEYETAISMRESYVALAENMPLAYDNIKSFNYTVAKNRASQDNFLKDIYYPNDCDWNNIELIDIDEKLKENYTLFK